ncbi:MAG: NAD(P)H-hydrate epimerase [Acidimicrobiia bacterium]
MTSSSFATSAGIEVPAVTADQMREVDRIAIEETGPNLYQMMENAGRNLAAMTIRFLGPDWRVDKIVVLVGTGGNGGGGICGARHLANRGGEVMVVVSDETRLGEVPAQQLATYRGSNGRVLGPGELGDIGHSLIIDAVIGYSLSGSPRGAALHMIEWAKNEETPVMSLDVPSGIDSTTGEAPGKHVIASLTMTLALPKTGLDVAAVGDLWLADIGIPGETYRRAGLQVSTALFGDEFIVPIHN